MKITRWVAACALTLSTTLTFAGPSWAETVLQLGHPTASTSHYGVAGGDAGRRVGEAQQRQVQGRLDPQRGGARDDRKRPDRHARSGGDLHRPGRQLRAGSGDRRYPLPVQGLRPRPRRPGRPDRPGHAEAVPRQGDRSAGLGRERLPPHHQQQAPDQHPRRRQGPEGPDHGKSGPHDRLPPVGRAADPDGLHGGLHRPSAGHGRWSGKPDPGHHLVQIRPGAEVPDADRARLFAGHDPDGESDL